MKILIGMILAVIGLVSVPLQAEAINKAELIDAIAAEAMLTKADSKKALDAFIKKVRSVLKRGDAVNIVGFGSLSVETGPTGKTVRFQPGQDLLDSLSLSPPPPSPPPPPPPPKPSCIYSLSKISQTFNAGKGSGSFSVTADSACSWYATKDADWITLTSGGSGKGNGTVNFTIQPNAGYDKRMGYITIMVGDKTFTATQYGKGGASAEGKPRPQ